MYPSNKYIGKDFPANTFDIVQLCEFVKLYQPSLTGGGGYNRLFTSVNKELCVGSRSSRCGTYKLCVRQQPKVLSGSSSTRKSNNYTRIGVRVVIRGLAVAVVG